MDGVVAEHRVEDNGATRTSKTQYWHKDHLGSLDVITGNIVARMSFEAFGERRDANSWGGASNVASLPTHHGYTGHEHMDSLGIIHMNGRLYDPTLGRFLSADPYVDNLSNSQSLNRYSYVGNNPLTATDPS